MAPVAPIGSTQLVRVPRKGPRGKAVKIGRGRATVIEEGHRQIHWAPGPGKESVNRAGPGPAHSRARRPARAGQPQQLFAKESVA
jgi:hypothetical protein